MYLILDYNNIVDYHLIIDSPENYTSHFRKSDSERPSFETSYHFSGCYPKNKGIIEVFNRIKDNINKNGKLITHKFKVIDRTLSWFFKRGRPGGGRGL